MAVGTRHPSESSRRAGGMVVPQQATVRQRLAARFIWVAVETVALTLRWRLHDRSGVFSGPAPKNLSFAIWHNRLALCLILYRRFVQTHEPQRRMAAMVSASRDGALLARVLELFAVEPVRGSTSRRGPQALRELTTWAQRGYDLALTPDGPRGPRYRVQEGPIWLAQITGQPIIPVSYRLSRKLSAPSWDRFQIPLPFSRCDVHFGEIVRVPSDADSAQREALREQLESTLKAITFD
jgi:lysophospholipid acyltransferase (LPLAT)-like uncharacterized protein